MTLKTGLLGIALAIGGTQIAFAHPDHKHEAPRPEVDEAGAKTRAKEEVDRLMSNKKIDESWKEATANTVEKKQLKKKWEWLVTFKNPTADAKQKTLYVFLKPSGDFVAANFTGK